MSTHFPLTRFGRGAYPQPVVSADEESVELLAALVDSPSEWVFSSTRRPLPLDGAWVASHSGVGDPENSLGIGAMWALLGTAAASIVLSNTWGIRLFGSEVRTAGGVGEASRVSGTMTAGGVGEASGVSGMIVSFCCTRKLVDRMRRPSDAYLGRWDNVSSGVEFNRHAGKEHISMIVQQNI